jgi:queuine tRNA-ribosyltransferase
LFIAGEILATRLLTLHNVYFYSELARRARKSVLEGTFTEWAEDTLSKLMVGSESRIHKSEENQ